MTLDKERMQSMVFSITFNRVPWSISPMEMRQLLSSAIMQSGLGDKFIYKITMHSVELEQ